MNDRLKHMINAIEQDLIDRGREHMSALKVPRKVQCVDALPKSGSGKAMWRLLQKTGTGAANR